MAAVDRDTDLIAPPLPVRASIYIAPDGTVHFAALFAELVPVAAALGHAPTQTISRVATTNPSTAPAAKSNTVSPPNVPG